MNDRTPAFRRQQIITSGYDRDAEPRDRITCTSCGQGVTVPRAQTVPMTAAQLGHRCGDPRWNIPPYIPTPRSRPVRREPVLTEQTRLAFEQAARREDVTA